MMETFWVGAVDDVDKVNDEPLSGMVESGFCSGSGSNGSGAGTEETTGELCFMTEPQLTYDSDANSKATVHGGLFGCLVELPLLV